MSPSILRDLLRGALAAVAGLSTFWFVFWLPCSILLPEGAPGLVPFAISFVSAAAVGRFVWRRSAGMSGGLASHALLGAAIVGGIGFAGGFVGPIILTPDANQGPLLGIFITGPLGALLGAVGGGIAWFVRRRTGGSVGREAGDRG